MSRLVLVGNSHVLALQQGYGQRPAAIASNSAGGLEVAFCWVRGETPEAPGDGTIWRTTSDGFTWEQTSFWYEPLVELVEAADCIAVQWGGGWMGHRALIARGAEFDVMLPESATDQEQIVGEVIPYSAVAEFAWSKISGNGRVARLMDLCEEVRPRKLAILGPPPPLPTEAVRERLPDSRWFVDRAQELGIRLEDVPIVGDATRIKLWRVMYDVYRMFGAQHGATLLEPPASVFDTSGALRSEFWGNDVLHANAEYGWRYLERVLQWAAE